MIIKLSEREKENEEIDRLRPQVYSIRRLITTNPAFVSDCRYRCSNPGVTRRWAAWARRSCAATWGSARWPRWIRSCRPFCVAWTPGTRTRRRISVPSSDRRRRHPGASHVDDASIDETLFHRQKNWYLLSRSLMETYYITRFEYDALLIECTADFTRPREWEQA